MFRLACRRQGIVWGWASSDPAVAFITRLNATLSYVENRTRNDDAEACLTVTH